MQPLQWKPVIITYYEYVFVALSIQHAKRMRHIVSCGLSGCIVRLKIDGTRAETRFRLSPKRTSPFLSRWGGQFSRLLAAEVCASALVMLDTPRSEVV